MNKKYDFEFYRQKILFLLKNDKEAVAKKMIKKIASNDFIKNRDLNGLYNFFSPIYDDLFYDMMFENIKITSSTKDLLEKLALPIYKMSDKKKDTILKDV